jgi:hypothetical protein
MYNTETSNEDRIWALQGWNMDLQPKLDIIQNL